jgi:hypothetical protein
VAACAVALTRYSAPQGRVQVSEPPAGEPGPSFVDVAVPQDPGAVAE